MEEFGEMTAETWRDFGELVLGKWKERYDWLEVLLVEFGLEEFEYKDEAP